MKYTLLIVFLAFAFTISAQQNAPTAQLLKEPATWTFERFALPPEFAPNFSYKGVEELRFSPGMFDKKSTQYFTYAFAAELDNRGSMSEVDVKDYLFNYFKGLCGKTAIDRKLAIDTSKITVTVEKGKNVSGNEPVYNAVLNVFGVFADGAPVKLNMEIKVFADAAAKKTCLLFIASPLAKTDESWKELYTIQRNFRKLE